MKVIVVLETFIVASGNNYEEAYKIRLEAEKKYFGEFSSKGGDIKNEQ